MNRYCLKSRRESAGWSLIGHPGKRMTIVDGLVENGEIEKYLGVVILVSSLGK